MYETLIKIGGDTETNCSIAGTLIGIDKIPPKLIEKVKKLDDYEWIIDTITKTKNLL